MSDTCPNPEDRRPVQDLEQPDSYVRDNGTFDVSAWARDVGELLEMEALTDEVAAIRPRSEEGSE